MSEEQALLELAAARCSSRDGTIAAALTLDAAGPCTVLVGRFAPLFALLSGDANLASGTARVLGADAHTAVQRGVAGLALSDPRLPNTWTAERYLIESAELAGFRVREARRSAYEILQRFELAARARHQLKDLPLIERRALVLASATIGSPRVLIAQAPLARLDAGSQLYLHAALSRAAEGRYLIVSVPELPPSGPERGLVEIADQVLWEHPATAPPKHGEGAARRLTLSVLAHADELSAAFSQQGIRFQPLPLDPMVLALTGGAPQGVGRWLIELPPGADTTRVLELARDLSAPIAELLPS